MSKICIQFQFKFVLNGVPIDSAYFSQGYDDMGQAALAVNRFINNTEGFEIKSNVEITTDYQPSGRYTSKDSLNAKVFLQICEGMANGGLVKSSASTV